MVLVDPVENQFAGQIVYLDFDGAEDVTYNGPVVVKDIDIPAFEAPGELAGQEAVLIAGIVTQLEETFSGTGVIFTSEQPTDGVEYSTVYVGGDNTPFEEYGDRFLGIAELIDIGNQSKTDEGFVFSKDIVEQAVPSAAANALVNIIEHEVGHLLGMQHTEASTGETLSDHAAEANFTTTKRGYGKSGGFWYLTNSIQVGFEDNTFPLNNSIWRGFAYFDLSGLSTATINSATVTLELSSIPNDTPSYINLYITDLSWQQFDTSVLGDFVWPTPDHYQDDDGSISGTLQFDVFNLSER